MDQTLPNDEWLTLNMPLLRSLWQKRKRTMLFIAPVLLIVVFGLALLVVPRKFTAMTSIALQGSGGGGGGGLGTLISAATGGSGQKSYAGVIQSYRFADVAAHAAHIREMYPKLCENDHDAAQLVQAAVDVDDTGKDGLIYISVALPGPPRLGSKDQEHKVKAATAFIANNLVNQLQDYLANTNTDHDAVLIRKGKEELQKARTDYDTRLQNMIRYITKADPATAVAQAPGIAAVISEAPGTSSPPAAGGGASGTAAATTAISELTNLYAARATLETKIASGEAAQRSANGILNNDNAASLPGEDPLLAQARADLRAAQTNLDTLRITLAETNPDVVAAKQRLALAQDNLSKQSSSIKNGQTSDKIALDAARAELTKVLSQIKQAEKRFKVGENAATEGQRLSNEVEISLKVYEAAAQQYAQLEVQTVAGDNMMDRVDAAQLPDYGKPGMGLLGAASAVLTITLLAIWIALEYLIRSSRPQSGSPTGGDAPTTFRDGAPSPLGGSSRSAGSNVASYSDLSRSSGPIPTPTPRRTPKRAP